MGQDFVARKQAKKQRKRQARDAETGRKSKKRRRADNDGFDVTADDDGLSVPGGEAGQKRQRKKGGGIPLRISRSLCYKPPQLTEADLRGGWGSDDDGGDDGGSGGGRLGGLKQSGYDSDVEEQLQQLPPAQLKQQKQQQHQKQQQKPKQPKPKLSTGIRLLDPVKAAQEASSRAQQHQQHQQQHQQLDEAIAASPALRELQQHGNVAPLVLRCMARLGFAEPTPIQAACWPAACAGRDLRGVAEPGSGKTLAYVLPALARLPGTAAGEAAAGAGAGAGAAAVAPEALVLVPSRELALQVAGQCSALFGVTGVRAAAVHGGVDRRQQAERLAARPPRLLVATPGRLLDLVDGGEISLGRVGCVVLDEADKMLSVGFEPQLQRLKAMLLDGKVAPGAPAAPAGGRPAQGQEKKRRRRKEEGAAAEEGGQGSRPQVLLFTATMPVAVAATAAAWLLPGADAVHCAAGSDSISRTITQVVHVCAEHKKPAKLLKHLAAIREASSGLRNPPRLLVFANKIKTVLFVHRTLVAEGFRAALLHGKRSQAERSAAVADFKAGKAQVLVASDVASRGLDITGLPFVVNYDFPPSLETYVHRVGRTGRLAASGHAYSFFTRPLAKLAGPLVELLQQHGQAVDPNLLALAQAWQQIEAALAAQGKSAEEAAAAAAAGGSDDEEEEEEGEGAAGAGGRGNTAAAAAAVPEDLQEGLPGDGKPAAGGISSKKQKQQPGQQDAAAAAAAAGEPSSQQQAKKKKARLAGDMLMVPVAAVAVAAAAGGISAPAEQFTPAARFSGARLGWAFKKGSRGLGYYWDAPSAAAAAARGQQLHEQPQPAAKHQAKQPKQQQQAAAGQAKAKSKPAAALPLLPGLARRQAAARRAAADFDSSDDANDVDDSDAEADASGGRFGGRPAAGGDDSSSSSDEEEEGGRPAGLGQRLQNRGRKKALPGRLRRKLAKHKAQAAAAKQGAGGGKGRPEKGGGSPGKVPAGRRA